MPVKMKSTHAVKRPVVSIVVPIFNVDKYLRQCLDSIIEQTLDDIEIICINDGSTDSSLEVLQEYSASDSRIVVISQENHGYGYALNRGIEMAQGIWLGIVESDDWIEKETFASLVLAATESNSQIAKANFWLEWTQLNQKSELFEYFSSEEDHKVIQPVDYMGGEIFRRKPSIWSAIYSMELVKDNGITFLETPGASFQDTSFTFKVFSLANQMVCLADAFVHYRQDNEASSINSKSKAYAVCDEYEEISRFVTKLQNSHPELKDAMIPAIYDCFMWNYERLDQTLKYPFLKVAAAWFTDILEERKSLDGLFRNAPWKLEAFHTIVKNPMGYHTWREDEKAEKNGVRAGLSPLPVGYIPHRASQSPLFSIIVPVYNVEKYLRGCLESIVNQSFEELEIICVNDGSQDLSRLILEEYQKRDERVHVIVQSNSGLADARNAGLDSATGDYVIFIDSDDWVSENMCETLANSVLSQPVETVIYGTEVYPGDPPIPGWLFDVLPVDDLYLESLTLDSVLTMKSLQTFSWRHSFSRSFLEDNHIRFDPKLRFGEDLTFGLIAFPKVSKGALFISDLLYHYRHWRPDSLMQKAQENKVEFLSAQLDLVKEACKIIQTQRYQPTSTQLGYLLDQIYGALTMAPEPQRILAIRRFLRITKKAGLGGMTEALSNNQRAFWEEMNRNKRVRYSLSRSFRKFVRNSKRRLQHLAPPSRAQLDSISRDLYEKLDRQNVALEAIGWHLHRLASTDAGRMPREVEAIETIALVLRGLQPTETSPEAIEDNAFIDNKLTYTEGQ